VVYCGTVGNEVRREYAAIGDVVNLAARLMSNAQGEILIDEATYMRLPSDVLKKMRKLDPLKIKGTDKEINPYVFDTSYISKLDGLTGDTENTLYEFIPIRQICRDAFYPLIHLISGTIIPGYQCIRNTRISGYSCTHNTHISGYPRIRNVFLFCLVIVYSSFIIIILIIFYLCLFGWSVWRIDFINTLS
jgi:hypothetical protein